MVRGTDLNTLGSFNLNWECFELEFGSLLQIIDDSISRIEKILELTRWSDQFDPPYKVRSTLPLRKDPLQPQNASAIHVGHDRDLPCAILPSFRTSGFFGRLDVLHKIEHYFTKVGVDHSFQSLALYELGGVGKSSIA